MVGSHRDEGRIRLSLAAGTDCLSVLLTDTLLHRTRSEQVAAGHESNRTDFPNAWSVVQDPEAWIDSTYLMGLEWRRCSRVDTRV